MPKRYTLLYLRLQKGYKRNMCFQKYGDGGNNRGNLIFFSELVNSVLEKKEKNQGKQWQSRQRLNLFAETSEKLDIYSTSRNLDQVQQGFLQTLRNSKKFLLSQCHFRVT